MPHYSEWKETKPPKLFGQFFSKSELAFTTPASGWHQHKLTCGAGIRTFLTLRTRCARGSARQGVRTRRARYPHVLSKKKIARSVLSSPFCQKIYFFPIEHVRRNLYVATLLGGHIASHRSWGTRFLTSATHTNTLGCVTKHSNVHANFRDNFLRWPLTRCMGIRKWRHIPCMSFYSRLSNSRVHIASFRL